MLPGRITRSLAGASLAGLMAAQEPSTFRVNTRLVEVDVVVRAQNKAVSGLTKNDFRILDNGKPQNIATFSVRTSKSSHRVIASPLPAGVISNRVSSTGEEPLAATVFLLDRLNTPVEDQSYFGKELAKYLKTLPPGEHIAIYSLLKSLRVVQDFTENPDQLLRAASKASAQQSVSLAASDESALKLEESKIARLAATEEEQAELQAMAEMATNALTEMEDYEKKNRALLTSRALEDIARHLRGLPGRKKLVWISAGFPIGALEVNARHYDEFGAEAAQAVKSLNNANVAVYAIDPRGLVAFGTNPMIPAQNTRTGQSIFSQVERAEPVGLNAPGIAGMNLFASRTGGRAFYGTNDMVGALQTVMEDDDTVYTLGFYPLDPKADGAYHSLSVKVDSKRAEVHHRRGYFASDTKVYTPAQRREAMTEAVQNPLDSTELALRATALALPDRPGVYRLSVALNLNELHLEHRKDRWVGTIDFGTHFSQAVDLKGTLETIGISLTEERLRESLRDGFVMRREIVAEGQSGQLRIVVQDRATGAIGSVRVPIGSP